MLIRTLCVITLWFSCVSYAQDNVDPPICGNKLQELSERVYLEYEAKPHAVIDGSIHLLNQDSDIEESIDIVYQYSKVHKGKRGRFCISICEQRNLLDKSCSIVAANIDAVYLGGLPAATNAWFIIGESVFNSCGC